MVVVLHWDYTVSVCYRQQVMVLLILYLDTISIEPLEVDTTWNVFAISV